MFHSAVSRDRSNGFLVRRLKFLRPYLNPLLRHIRPLLQPSRIHILFLVHDFSYLRNFDDCIWGLIGRGHKVTLAFPDRVGGKPQRKLEWFTKKGIGVRMVPRSRRDQWETLTRYVRQARSFLLYRKSVFAPATYLQERVAEMTSEDVKTFLEGRWIRPWPRMTDFVCRVLEAAIPASDSARRDVAELKPDVVLITPYFTASTRYQVEYAKAAQEIGVPVGVPVFSWDNLTSKGAMQVRPDRLLVWNRTQVREAVSLHKIPASRIVITGGMRFSMFFGMAPSVSKKKFCESVGLDPSRALITYLGSSRTIAPREHEFLWRWIDALRAAEDPDLRECNVFVRPHPGNSAIWDHWPSTPQAGVALWDGHGKNVRGVIDSVGHSAAVMGINTTAMLEAAALNKPVLTVLDNELRAGQIERIHFHYLTSVAGGLVTVANSLEEHVGHLTAILAGDRRFSRKSRRFSKAFLRPPWPYRSPVRAFENAVERLGHSRRPMRLGRLLPRLLRPAAAYLARRADRYTPPAPSLTPARTDQQSETAPGGFPQPKPARVLEVASGKAE